MTEGKWVLTKIAAVHLRLPNVSDDLLLRKFQPVGATSIKKRCSCGRPKRLERRSHHARKRDVSNEPRIPAGQSDGGEWTTDGGSEKPMSNPFVVPAQAIAPPMPMPWIDLLPDLPTEVTPLPLQIPNGEARELPKNPYPDRPDCAAQWAAAYEFCSSKRKEFKKGYHGWGENMAKCLLGQVTADCGPTQHEERSMSKVTSEDIDRSFDLLRQAPREYLALANELIRLEPDNPDGYWARYMAYKKLGQYELALADVDKVLSHEQEWLVYEARGNVLRALGRYREALDSYNRAEAVDPKGWYGGFGRLFRAECHARLGNEKAALEDCAALRDDHWTPGLLGAPEGNKQEVAYELRRLARQARKPRLV